MSGQSPVDAPKVSVLVPVYNVEKYLAKCLDSLCSQTLREIEIICINDGSTDGSTEILRSYARKDARVKVIEKPNSGYGASMNRGIDEAAGEYIAIVESDDFASRFMLKCLYKAAKRFDCDLVKSNFFEHYGFREYWIKNFDQFPYGTPFDPADKPQVICTVPAIWTGLYRREMLLQENIRFRETPGAAFQDTAFTLKAWFAAKSCVLVKWPLLHYRIDNPNSSVKTSDKALIVCDELAEAERYLRERPDRLKSFIGCFHADKFGKYRWNYERVSPSLRVQFIERMRNEYRFAEEQGELDRDLYAPQDWSTIQQLLQTSAEDFFEAHPSAL